MDYFTITGNGKIFHNSLNINHLHSTGFLVLNIDYICNMKRIALFSTLLLMALGCRQADNGLRNGDLVFVGIPLDYSLEADSMSSAISASTGKDSLNLIHVAIAEVKADSVWIIDATIRHGVDRHPLDTFLTDFTLKDGSLPEFIIKRVEGVDADAAVERAKTYCGRAYDTRFLPDNEDLYCSELVQLSYLSATGEQVFDSDPMNFLAPDGTMPVYWEQLFAILGMDVPQGLPGTNPQRMSESNNLIYVPVHLKRQ